LNIPSVLVTGAGSRVGAAIARHFGERGWHIVVHYHTMAAPAEQLAEQLPSAEAIGFDLSDPADITAAVWALQKRLKDWPLLINNASLFVPDTASAPDGDVFDAVMNANLKGNILLSTQFLKAARSTTGRRIINLLDQKIANLNPDFFSYTLSKVALAAAVEMMAQHHFGTTDRIYGLAPGLVLPSHDQTQAEFEVSGRMNLLNRLNSPAEIAEAAWFLANGPLASGETLFVDSGQHLLRQQRDVMYTIREPII
jgi:NAD(P)-dependent dehydrogenase (short-subunit alcohol dehydrogenase family)